MARHTYGGSISDWAFTFNSDGSVAQAGGAVISFWDALSGGTQYPAAPMPGGVDDLTGLLDNTGVPVTTVECDTNGEIPDAVAGPDEVYRMAADASGTGSGPRRWIYANDIGGVLTQLLDAVVGVPALEAMQQYVYYDTANAAYPARPDTTAPVVWVGPVQPPTGGSGADESKNDTWDDSTGSTAPGGVSSVTAADGSVVVTGTATAPVLATGPFDELADLHPPAGPWSNNGQKIQHVANGVAADDVATVGQIGVTLDSTAADIKADGNQAAGATGKAADAGHVHPASGIPRPADMGIIAWTTDPLIATGAGGALTAGKLMLVAFWVHKSATLSTIGINIATGNAGSGLTAGQNWAGIYSSAGALVGQTADQSTAWAATGTLSMAITSPFTATPGMYWLALLGNGTTTPNPRGVTGISTTLISLGQAAAASRIGVYGSAQTTLPGSITPASIVQAGANVYCAVIF